MNPYSDIPQPRELNTMVKADVKANQPSYALPPNYRVNNSGRRFDVFGQTNQLEKVYAHMGSQEKIASEVAKVENAKFFSNYLNISFDEAYASHDSFARSIYPNESLSSETFRGRMKMVYNQKAAEQEIAMLRWNQLNGDSSKETQDKINMLKVGQPRQSEMDRIMENLGQEHKNMPSKIVEAVKGTPYMMASQLPMWVSQARHGVITAASGAAAGAALGAVGAPVTALGGGILGFVGGGARYEFMMESGLAYDEMLSAAAEEGVEIDIDVARKYAKISAGLITAIDNASLLFGIKAVAGGATKAASEGIKQITRQSMKQIISGAAKDIAKATAGEAAGEWTQEVIGGITKNLAYELNEQIGNGHIDRVSAEEILSNANAAMLMASTTAAFASGVGASFTAGKTIKSNHAAVKTEQRIQATSELSKLSTDQIQNIAEKVKNGEEVDLSQEIPDTAEPDSGFLYKFGGSGAVKVDMEQTWNDVVNRYGIEERPEGISIKLDAFSENIKTPEGAFNGFFEAYQENGKTVLESKMIEYGDGSLSSYQETTVKATVFQGEYGLDLAFDQDYAVTSKEWHIARQMRQNLDNMFEEGQWYDPSTLNLDESTKMLIRDFNEWRQVLGEERIEDLKSTQGLGDWMGQMADEMQHMDRYSKEYTMMKQTLRKMGLLRTDFIATAKGWNSTLQKIKQMMSDKSLWQARLDEIRRVMETQYKATFKLDQKELNAVQRIKEKIAEAEELGQQPKISKAQEELLNRSDMRSLEDLSYDEINSMVSSMEKIAYAGERETKVTYGPMHIRLDKAIAMSAIEIETQMKNRKEADAPITIGQAGIMKRLGNRAAKMLTLDQTQYHWLIGHLAGRESITNEILYRNIRKAERSWWEAKNKLIDLYNEDMDAAPFSGNELWKWGNETLATTVGGKKMSKSWGMSILMHSRNAYNRGNILNEGMVYFGDQGQKNFVTKEEVRSILKEMNSDPTALQLEPIIANTYKRLQPMIDKQHKRLYSKDMHSVENYFPVQVDPDVWLANMPNPFEMKNEDRLTTQKGFLYERTDEYNPLVLESVFDTLNRSIHQETKFANMELQLYQAQAMTQDVKFRRAVTDNYSSDHLDAIISGIKAGAGYQHEHGKVLDTPLMKIRNNVVRAVIGLNPFVAAKAPISWIYGNMYVKPEYMFKGLVTNTLDEKYKSNIEFLMNESPGFRERVLGGSLAEVNDVLSGKSTKRLVKSGGSISRSAWTYDDILFYGVKTMDKHTVASVMTGAILQARQEFADGHLSTEVREATGLTDDVIPMLTTDQKEAAAIAFAEDVMDISQPSFNPLNRNAFQRGSSIERFFSIYGSFTTVTHNMFMNAAHAYKTQGSAAIPMISTTLGLWALSSVANAGIDTARDYITGKEPTPWWNHVTKAMFGNAFVVRNIEGTISSKIRYGFTGGSSIIPAEDILSKSVDAGYMLITAYDPEKEEIDVERFIKGMSLLGDAAGKASGIPVMPIKYGLDSTNAHIIGDGEWKEEWTFEE